MREDLQKWLLGLGSVAAACQIVFHAGNVALQGCAYLHDDRPAAPRFYLLGGPKSFNKRVRADKYVFEWDKQKKFPRFNRELPPVPSGFKQIHSQDWFVYCSWARYADENHPFGENMVIGEWHQEEKIDAHPELCNHRRIKMSVDFETKFITPKGKIYRV
jgi:hypothetical protein